MGVVLCVTKAWAYDPANHEQKYTTFYIDIFHWKYGELQIVINKLLAIRKENNI